MKVCEKASITQNDQLWVKPNKEKQYLEYDIIIIHNRRGWWFPMLYLDGLSHQILRIPGSIDHWVDNII